jgi:AcrR family transcriptional regulator
MARPIGSKSKAKILIAVEKLIANKGINSISLRDIAAETKLSPGTLYYHYTTKDDIVFDIIAKHIDELKNEYVAWLSRHQTDLTPERFLEVIFFKGVKLFNRARLHIFIINQCMVDNVTLTNRFKDKYSQWRSELKKGVINVFPHVKNPESFASLLLTIIDGLVIQEVLGLPEIDQHELINFVKNMGDSDD